jgi:hypothetical protein
MMQEMRSGMWDARYAIYSAPLFVSIETALLNVSS